MHVFSSAYNEYTVISKEYIGPLDFDITGVDCNSLCIIGSKLVLIDTRKLCILDPINVLLTNTNKHAIRASIQQIPKTLL